MLCPSDVSWEKRGDGAVGGLAHTVSFRALNEVFARLGGAGELTVVLDTCHAGGAASAGKAGKALTLTGSAASEAGEADGEPLAGRVLRASRRGEVAYQTKLDGRYRGLFSWAVSTAMEQWRATQDGDGVRLDLGYGKLVETAGRLMSALWFDQTPELSGPEGVADLAVFQAGLAARPDATTEKPNGKFLTEQLDSGTSIWRCILMMDQTGTPIATIYIFNQAIGSYLTGKEYWFVNRGQLGSVGTSTLTLNVSDSSSSTAPADPGYTTEQRFSQPQTPTGGWGAGWTTDPISGGDLYAGPNGTYLRLFLSAGSPAVVTRVVWYQVLASGTPANINPAGSWTVSSGAVPVPSGSTGYSIAQTTS